MKNFVPAIRKAYRKGLIHDTDTIGAVNDDWCSVGNVIFFEITPETPDEATFKAKLEMEYLKRCEGEEFLNFILGLGDELDGSIYIGV